MTPPPSLPRRRVLALGAAGAALALPWRVAVAQSPAISPVLQAVERQWGGGRPITEGRVRFDIAALVENGNVVPIAVQVDSPMTEADHVTEIMVFNERNPFREVLRAELGPANGVAQVQTRMRLATSQQLVALARMKDGSQWSHHVDVLVTLAACIEP